MSQKMMGFLALLALMASSAWGAEAKNTYYGREFFQAKESGPALKARLHTILRNNHEKEADNGYDKVGACASGARCYSHRVIGYDAARKFILGEFYLVPMGSGYGVKDVYCNRTVPPAEFNGDAPSPGKVPDHTVVNVEHTWPQSDFSKGFVKDEQKSDLHHLFPTDSEMNSRRSSFAFGTVVSPSREGLKCSDSKLGEGADGSRLVFEPPTNHKGNVARALFYFSTRYNMRIGAGEEAEIKRWNREDPVDTEERARNERIFQLQGSRNPFVDYPELAERIEDF